MFLTHLLTQLTNLLLKFRRDDSILLFNSLLFTEIFRENYNRFFDIMHKKYYICKEEKT